MQPKKHEAAKHVFMTVLCTLAVLMVAFAPVTSALAIIQVETPEIVNTFVLGELGYKLVFDANKPANAPTDAQVENMPPVTELYKYEIEVAAPSYTFNVNEIPTLTGYQFMGWALTESATKADYVVTGEGTDAYCAVPVDYKEDGQQYTPATETKTAYTTKTVYAVWEQMDFTVTFHSQVEDLAVEPASKTVTYQLPYGELPTPVRTGYHFDGWTFEATIAPDVEPTYITSESIVNIAADHDLYAQWSPITYQVKYNIDTTDTTISGTMENSTFTYDVESKLPAIGYQKADYKFAGWSTTPTGIVIYADEHSPILNLASEQDDVVNLYAQWIPSTQYLITYHANAADASFAGGTKAFTESKTHDVAYTLKTPTEIAVTRNNYWIWTEWNTKSDGSGTTYLGGASYTGNTDLDLYAIWQPRTEVVFDLEHTDFVNMAEPSKEISADGYHITVKCKTQSGADGIAFPIKNLIPGQAYRLTFSVDFDISKFYTEDNHAYMFGMNIMDQYKDYHTTLSIIARDNVKVTSKYENMMWSTEKAGHHEIFIDFVPSHETMYWFWETTDITDHILMKYTFNNFNIQRISKPQPRVEFENLYVTYETAPSKANSVWGPPVGEPVRHKNYFHTEQYDFDYLRYRQWGTEGHERMTIPISGLEVGQWYELSFTQDLSKANVYNKDSNSLNGNQLYGAAITEAKNLSAPELTSGNGVHNQKGWQDLRKAKVGANYNGSFTFQATAETMYWQWTLGDLVDGTSGTKEYSWVTLSNVEVTETDAVSTADVTPLSLAYNLPGVTVMGTDTLTVNEPAVLTLTGSDIPDVLNVEVTGTQTTEPTVSTFALRSVEPAADEAQTMTTTLYMTGLNEALVNASAAAEGATAQAWLTANADGSQTLILPAELMTEGTTITITGESYHSYDLSEITYEHLN